MFILSNKSILAIFAIATCMASFADAEGTRGQARRLKSSKADKADNGFPVRAKPNNFVNAVVNSVTTSTNINTAVVTNSNTVSSFEAKCSDGVLNAIERCSPLRPFICKTCVVSQSNLNTPTVNGVLKCGNIKTGGRICYGCDDQVILDYYNCGTGENMMLPGSEPVVTVTTPGGVTVTTPAVTTPAVTNPGLTTPSMGGTTTIVGTAVGSGTTTTVTATVSSSDGIIPGPPPDASYCPPENVAAGEYIESGAECNTSGYEYLQCYYPGKVCSCYAIQPQFACLDL